MQIEQLRDRIDDIDQKLSALFVERMDAARDVAEYKQQVGKKIYDPERERQVLGKVAELAGPGMERYIKALYTTLFEVSRNHQASYLGARSPLWEQIQSALQNAPAQFPTRAGVACQGVEGAYAQQACDRMIEIPGILYVKSFDAVFSAVEQGMCQYGVLPIENSAAGSVTQVYDLMERHKFRIVRGIRQRIDHTLLARPGTKFADVKEIFSHPQALSQCGDFLRAHPSIKATPVDNTAMAAKLVCESDRRDIAAIASGRCRELYDLVAINQGSIQNTDNNFTRFILIGKEFEVFPGANKISMTLSLPHQPGALHRMLSRFAAASVNLTKLESRPIAGRDFEFRFHFDIEASLGAPGIAELLCDIERNSEDFVLLGNYLEGY